MSSSAKADDPVIIGTGKRHRLASTRVRGLLDARLRRHDTGEIVLGLSWHHLWRRHDGNAEARRAMVALKGADIDKFVARPDPARPIVLVFGPDAGLVRERAEA